MQILMNLESVCVILYRINYVSISVKSIILIATWCKTELETRYALKVYCRRFRIL